MGNSKLVDYTRISPNKNSPRNQPIRKITIHHMAGDLSVEVCGAVFADPKRQASSNYGIGSDGRVGMYVEEKDRSWCSSSPDNDHQAVTIEVANSTMGPNWEVSDAAMDKLIELCTDICTRRYIYQLQYTGDTSGNLTMHKWFAATACPGPYLESKFPFIAEEVNRRLKAVNGWQYRDGKWYYYTSLGMVKSQWVKYDGYWYYIGPDGVMQTGWVMVDNEIFYLNPSPHTINGRSIPIGACIITDNRGALV